MTRRLKIPMAVLLGLLAVAMFAVPVQAATATSYSGEATVVHVTVPTVLDYTLGHAGPLPAAGGSFVDEILNANVSQAPLILTASVIKARTEGAGSTVLSVATAKDLNLNLTLYPDVESTTLKSTAIAVCGGDGAVVAGSSIIEGLEVEGASITATGAPNQEFDLLGTVHGVMNEQILNVAPDGSSGAITVTALHITVYDPLGGPDLAEVILSSAHADVTCPADGNGTINPRGDIGGPCADPSYYGIFDNTASTVALTFRFRHTNGYGVHNFTKLVPAGAIYRTWEKWSTPGTKLSVAYKAPNTGKWVTLATDVAVRGYFAPCIYKHGFEYPITG